MTEKIEILVTSNGSIDAETKKAKELSDQLNSAAKAADLAARTAAKINGTSSNRANKRAEDLANETDTYRKQRGTFGSGSSTRDFSNQAAGLGGLVRIYATFAANIYALTTAFSMLNKAADVTNMAKGLDQLGAASGRNLGGLAKQLTAVSDGAISMKDAMVATAAASAGGLNGDQLLRLTAVAKNASQALGRDMPDALNRLTRGITKIEPELLDELGILVKVDMANQNYARSLGKTASSLTDLERRQAFATEAITQGEKKFKDIQMASNPYAKLSASVQNLSQSGLELLNKVLTPIAEVLSSSPTALTVAILGLSSVLFKQAIPDVKAWRDSLKEAELTAAKTATETSSKAQALRDLNTGKAKEALNAMVAAKKLEAEEFVVAEKKKAEAQLKQGAYGTKLAKPGYDITQDNAADKINYLIGNRTAAIKKAEAELATIEDAALAKSKQKSIDSNRQKIAALQDALQTRESLVNGSLTREAEISNLEVERDKAVERRKVSNISQASADRAAIRAKDRLESIKALESISEVSKSEGFMAAMSQSKSVVAASGMTTVAKATTLMKGGFIAAADAAAGMWATIAPWLPLLILGFEALSYAVSKFSGNSKEVDTFNKSIEALESSIKGAGATAALMSKKELTLGLNSDDIKAKSNAMVELSNATKSMVDDLNKADKAATGFGKFMDWFKQVWGGDLRTKATKGLSDSLATAVLVADTKTKEQLSGSLKEILGTTDLTAEGIKKALDSIDDSKIEDFKLKVQELTYAQENAKTTSEKQSNALLNVKDALSTTSKAADTLTTSLAPSDNFSKYAIAVVQSAYSMAKAINGSADAYLVLQEIINSPSNMAGMSEEAATKLLQQSKAAKVLSGTILELKNIEAERQKAIKSNAELAGKSVRDRDTSDNIDLKARNDDIIARTNKNAEILADKEVKLQRLSADYVGGVIKDSMEKGSLLFEIAVKQSMKESALIISKASLAGLEGRGTAELMANLKAQEIEIQKAQLQQELELLTSQAAVKDKMELLSIAVQENTNALKKSSLQATVAGGGEGAKAATLALEQLSKVEETNTAKAKGRAEKLFAIMQDLKSQSLDKRVESLKNLAKAERENTRTGDLELAAALQSKYMEAAAVASKVRMKNAELTANEISKELALIKETFDYDSKQINNKKEALTLANNINKAAKDASPIFSQAIRDEENRLAAAKEKLQYEEESIKQIKIMDELRLRQSKGENVSTQMADAKKQGIENLAKVQGDIAQDQLNRSKVQQEEDIKFLNIKLTQIAELEDLEINASRVRLDAAANELQAKVQLGKISSEYAAELTYQYSLQNIELEKQKALSSSTKDFLKTYSDTAVGFVNTNEANDKKGTPTSAKELQAQSDELNRIFGLYQQITGSIKAKADKEVSGAKTTKNTTLEIEKQAKVLKLMEGVGNSLEKVFGKVGKAFGNIGKTILSTSKELNSLRDQQSSKTEMTAEEEQKYALKTAQVKIGAAADVTGAVADSLDQQSKGAKVLHDIEKGLHIAKIVMAGVEMAMDMTQTTQEIASSEARAVVKGKESIINAMKSLPPPFSFIAGAAMAVAVASIIGKNLGGGGGGGFAPSSDQLKETQGTGFTWGSDGKKVSTGYGVLGDDSAKSESIANSLEFIQKYTFTELEYSNKMLTALQNIEMGINGFSTGIANTKGTLSGTGFNTFEGTSSSKWGNVLGGIFGGKSTTSITGSGIRVSGSLGDLADGQATAKQYETGSTTTKGGWFSSDKTVSFTKEQAISSEAFNKAIKDSFTGMSNTIKEAGVAIGLDSKLLADSIAQIPIELGVETRGLKGSEISDAVSAVLSSTADMIATKVLYIVKPFQALNEGLAETAIRVARSSQVIDLQLKSVGMVFKTVGLESLNARMNLVDLAGGLEKFVSDSNFFKDNFLSEAERLAPIQKAVTEEMSRLGYAGITTREAFKDLVLSLDLSDSNGAKLYNSLMKVQEGFATVYKETEDVTKKLSEIKLDQEARAMALVANKSQLLAYNRGKELAAMDATLRPMESWIYALEDEATAREELSAAYERESAARQQTIDNLKSSIKTLGDFSKSLMFGENSPLTPGDKYSQAKSDYTALKDVLLSTTSSSDDKAKALEELPTTITTLLDVSKTFYASSDKYQQDYADAQALLALKIADSKAQLTIEEKSFNELTLQVNKLGVINESVINVSSAIDRLTNAMLNSLSTGKAAGQLSGMSGDQVGTGPANTQVGAMYVNKSNYIGSIVEGWYANHPYANKSPDAAGLKYWTDEILSGKGVEYVKKAFTDSVSYVSGKTPVIAIDAFAKGGYMDGMALVGEAGPELVNFSNPGQVYSNAQSSNLMDSFSGAITAELVLLRKQVATLEEAARVNAEAIIRANFAANNQAADKVSDAVTNAAETENWNTNRNVVEMK